MRTIDKIVVHHTASPNSWTYDDVKASHLERGFDDIGYHYLIEHNGTVRLGRHVSRVGAHCKGYNANSVGVCVVGSFEDGSMPTDEQWDAVSSLCADLLRQHPGSELFGHKELKPTLCPGFDPQKLRDTINLMECEDGSN
jgi:N-acetylmuramoyl-L-alanine amidase